MSATTVTEAMSQAKAAGRNCVVLASHLPARGVARVRAVVIGGKAGH
jgi:hypothetical protein